MSISSSLLRAANQRGEYHSDALRHAQDDTLAAQAALEKQLSAVGDDVEGINSQVGEVSAAS